MESRYSFALKAHFERHSDLYNFCTEIRNFPYISASLSDILKSKSWYCIQIKIAETASLRLIIATTAYHSGIICAENFIWITETDIISFSCCPEPCFQGAVGCYAASQHQGIAAGFLYCLQCLAYQHLNDSILEGSCYICLVYLNAFELHAIEIIQYSRFKTAEAEFIISLVLQSLRKINSLRVALLSQTVYLRTSWIWQSHYPSHLIKGLTSCIIAGLSHKRKAVVTLYVNQGGMSS